MESLLAGADKTIIDNRGGTGNVLPLLPLGTDKTLDLGGAKP